MFYGASSNISLLFHFLFFPCFYCWVVPRIPCFRRLLFPKFGGRVSGFIVCRKHRSNSVPFSYGTIEIRILSGLRLSGFTYFTVFFSHVRQFGFYRTLFISLIFKTKSLEITRVIVVPAKRLFAVLGISRFRKHFTGT